MHEKKSGLLSAYCLDGKGGGVPLSMEEISSWSPERGVLWCYFDYSSPTTRHWLREDSGLEPATVKALIAPETRPRCLHSNRGTFLSLRGVNLNPGHHPEDMVSLRLWVEPHRIILTRKRKVLSIKDVQRLIERGEGPTTVGDCVEMINEHLSRRMADIFERIRNQIDVLEEKVITGNVDIVHKDIASVRREIIMLKRYLSPQHEALLGLVTHPPAWLNAKNIEHLHESTDKVVRHIEDLDASRDRASIVYEEITHRLSYMLNRRMYLLSVVTLVFLPITFVTGALGMNVMGVPGSEVGHGFAYAMTVIMLIGIIILLVLYRKKWI